MDQINTENGLFKMFNLFFPIILILVVYFIFCFELGYHFNQLYYNSGIDLTTHENIPPPYQFGNIDILRATHGAVITRGAVPERIALKHLLLQTGIDHGNNLTRCVIHETSHRAGAGTRPTLKACLDWLPFGGV